MGTRMILKFKTASKVVVFVDNANMIHALSTLGWKASYKKIKKYFEAQTELVGIYFYSAYATGNKRQQKFLEMLSRWGFILRTKEVKVIKQQDGSVVWKGDMDIEIAIDIFELLDKFDIAVLLSGDSDFAPLVEWLHTKKKKVIVISTRPHISKELVRTADKFIDLGRFKDYWKLD